MMREQSMATEPAFAEVADPSQSAPRNTIQMLQKSIVSFQNCGLLEERSRV
jgi:hypothetical protein